MSRELVIKCLSYVFSADAILWRLYINKDDREVETFVGRWLITEGMDWYQYCVENSTDGMTSALFTAATVQKTRGISVHLDLNCSYQR